MTFSIRLQWILLAAANGAFWCMLSLQQTVGANPRTTAPSGPSATQQRAEMIAQLKEIKAELKTLTSLRQNGALPVIDTSQP